MNTHCIEVRRTFKYRMYRNDKIDKHLFQAIDMAGIIWNHCVALQRRYYRLTGKYIPIGKLQSHLGKLRMKRKRFACWQKLGSQAVQEIAQRLDAAYQRFFAREAGRPRFKKVKKFKSFVLKQAGWKLFEDKTASPTPKATSFMPSGAFAFSTISTNSSNTVNSRVTSKRSRSNVTLWRGCGFASRWWKG